MTVRYSKTIPVGPKVAVWAFSLIALVFLVIAIVVAINTNSFINSSVVTNGEVIDVYNSESRDSDGSTSVSIYAIVKFNDALGNEIVWRANTTTNEAIIIGEKVKIRYEPGNPKNASYDTWIDIWFAVVLLSIFFIFFSGFAIAFIYFGRKG